MIDFDVLLPEPPAPYVAKALEGKARVHKLWEAPKPEAFLAQIAGDIRGIVNCSLKLPLNGEFLQRFPKLEIIAHHGVGYDQVDAKWAAAHHIIVTNTPDVLNEEVADLALGLLLSTVRSLPQADAFLRAGQWEKGAFPLSASLRGRSMGILGLGRIGKAIAARVESFGVTVSYHGRHAQADVGYRYYPTLLAMAKECDILMVVAPGTAETKHMVNAEILQALGADGILINVARGSLVDEAALVAALQDGVILSAGLDVFADEPHVPPALIALPNVVLLPHVGSGSHATRQAMGQLVVDNLLSYARGTGPITPVPETPWPRV